jgi:hypothetical protein
MSRFEDAAAQARSDDLPKNVLAAYLNYESVHAYGYPEVWAAARKSKLVRLMKEAADKGDTEPFKVYLDDLLDILGIEPPPGVITHSRKVAVGA